MGRIHPHRRSEVRLLADLETILTPEPRPRAPLLIWRWRYELASLLTIAFAVVMRAILRAACWAADGQIARDERRSQLVIVDVIRRRDEAAL